MSYAIKIGTTEANWIDAMPTPEGCVRFDGDLVESMVWDEAIQNIRPALEGEIPALALSVTPWQIRKALNAVGLRDAVESAVATSTDITVKDGWEFATEFREDDVFVISLGAAMGKTSAEMHGVFLLAKSL